MEACCRQHGEKEISEWVDNQDVCLLLNISLRTLQTLRNNGTLAHTQISHKIYYKLEDVEKIVPLVEDKRRQAAIKQNFMSNQLITENNERVKSFFHSLDRLFSSRKPTLNGESFYPDKELSKKLKLSRRGLQDYRNEGRIPYIKLGGKILYRASDIEKLLENGYQEKFK